MPHSHRDDRNRGTLGTVLLAGACCAGALAYAAFVAPSMLPPPDVATTNAVLPEVGVPSGEPEEEERAEGPVGHLEVHVSDHGRAWVQTLTCTGDLDEDHSVCAALAEATEELESEHGSTAGEQEEQGEQEGALEAGSHPSPDNGSPALFTEVREGMVCTDNVYGPQEATITGVWEGQEIETTLSRKGSCEEARWQRLSVLTDQIS